MTDPSVVYDLLAQTEAAALVYEPSFKDLLQTSPLPTFPAADILSGGELEKLPPVPAWHPNDADDVLFIFHTSGSMSGIPKLVPLTAKWLDCMLKLSGLWRDKGYSARDHMVFLHIGSFCHLGATNMLWVAVREGSCIALPSIMPQPAPEIHHLLDKHGLSSLVLFPPFLSTLLREARKNTSLLASLKKADFIGYCGLEPDPTDMAWVRSQGLHVLNAFGSTEVGMMMISSAKDNTDELEMVPGTKCELIPIGEKLESGEELLELVVPPEAPNCPVPNLRDADGKFHTGDLFIEVRPGKYVCKGRNDNWIKMEVSLRCDTVSIENNVMETCGDDLVSAVVVVGVGRPCPTIIIEPRNESLHSSDEVNAEDAAQKLKEEILRRITPFHQRRYMHERVDHTQYIVVVPQGTLPRTTTKGNVRRKEAEKAFAPVLDAVYA
ncbi:unnamed protein product, partial [Fusarium langsethiae]